MVSQGLLRIKDDNGDKDDGDDDVDGKLKQTNRTEHITYKKQTDGQTNTHTITGKLSYIGYGNK